MRVLLSTSGSRGDVEPLVALAVRLRDLGAEVRMCAPPASAERLAEVGVPLVPVGQEQRMMLRDGMPPPSPEEERCLLAGGIDVQFDQVPPAAEGCDAVVATGELGAAVAVRSVAEKLGVPYFYAAYSTAYLPSSEYPPPLDEPTEPGVTDNRVLWDQRGRGFRERFGDPVAVRRAAIGLPPVEDIFAYGYTERPWLAADPVLAPLHPDLDAVQTGVWLLPDERPLPSELEAFLAAGPPPVYVGFGSFNGIGDPATAAVEAIRAQGRRVVLSRGWAEFALPDDRDDCLAVDEVNFQVLFGRVAAVVHHGGAGTTHVATRAGVPQVVIPQYTDQPYYAGRVAELGVGVAHDGPVPTFDSLSAALVTALAPETRARATAVADTMRTDGTTVAAELLFDAVSRVKASA
ncbi:glycosyltransferase [Umezawaea endophytica]|uniref:Glycosyltransferase n=1 Tax=Umezawaea endophytica TaxID=1654476 RepID=A0A9X3AF63_9PSEU|nr:glycosyltransferase [Umezawaea endophytica]MCS7477856.1 glycosyltransferase [Umezawaea endophytica]